ncbi:hypothetical protein [Thiomicrorhabdus cannonii]|uniref:hypothetical protein n=1 Tax=Thiomicrorhabdus cannonii TaxID=2748011 RepID=UPI0015BDE876|nr:hypothetical protein [Thiomicrorhabdus cannonii]
MIYLFRVFEDDSGDYLEFVSREDLIAAYNQQKNPQQYNWGTVGIKQAMSEETRLSKLMALKTMQSLGDKLVVRTVVKGEVNWYSPNNSHGIPSEYTIAVKFFSDHCAHYRLTNCHHEVFEIANEMRFRALTQDVIGRILQRVENTRCAQKLDRYLNMNLRKLRQYGVESLSLTGSYLDIQKAISKQELSCPFFGSFLEELLALCVEKEKELVGEPQIYEKII